MCEFVLEFLSVRMVEILCMFELFGMIHPPQIKLSLHQKCIVEIRLCLKHANDVLVMIGCELVLISIYLITMCALL